MDTLPSLLCTAGVGLLLLAAAVSDLSRFTIPNWISLALVLLYLGASGASGTPVATMVLPLLLAVAVLLAGAVAFERGWIGGGDVKLLAAASLWVPPAQLPGFLVLVAVLGGALAALVLAAAVIRRATAAAEDSLASIRLPYGVAISAAGMLTLFGGVQL